jgi:hypothetical protein
MSALPGDSLLLGALLERLGSAQGQSLLARLNQWLSRDDRDATVEDTPFDRNQSRAIDAAYDRRKQTRSGPHNPMTAS